LRRQVSPREPDLLFDQVEVVEQPFGRRRDPALALHRLRDQGLRLLQDLLVLAEPGQQQIGPRLLVELVPFGQRSGVLLESLPERSSARSGVSSLDRSRAGWTWSASVIPVGS
jgi:hypothetical protein